MTFNLSANEWWALHVIVTLAGVLLYVITSHAMLQRRSPTAAIAWVLFILLIPYLALPLYLVFGSRKLPPRKAIDARNGANYSEAGSWAIQMAEVLNQPAPADYHHFHLHADGREARAALFGIIETAQYSIDVCTFIFQRDEFGEAVLNRLCERARTGVRVRVMIDGLGSLMVKRPNMKRLVQAGGAWTLFVPPFSALLSGRANLRDHRKLLVADAGRETARLMCGGRNIGGEYFEGNQNLAPWRDLSFDLRGAVVAQAERLFEHDWRLATQGPIDDTLRRAAPATARHGAQLIASGPDQADDTLQALLLTATYHASKRIILSTPYFVPDAALLQGLCLAARRGVSVELLLPARSNHRLSDLARCRALRSLARAGAHVRFIKGMLHAKLVIIDDCWALSGSANLDTRSLFLNYEAMMAFQHVPDVQLFVSWFEREWAGSHPYVAKAPNALRDLAEGLLLWTAFEL